MGWKGDRCPNTDPITHGRQGETRCSSSLVSKSAKFMPRGPKYGEDDDDDDGVLTCELFNSNQSLPMRTTRTLACLDRCLSTLGAVTLGAVSLLLNAQAFQQPLHACLIRKVHTIPPA